jgi:type II secretory pathway predicted ATPase ExeA
MWMSAYLKFFELEKSPFDTSAQSNLVLGTKALRGAFAEIETGMAEGAARICVTGDAGMGKTSLARALPKLLGAEARVVLLLNPSLPWSTLRAAIVKQLELAKGMLSRKALMEAAGDGRRLVLAVDQAELTSQETLEHLDILLGYRSDSDEQLITCILLTNMQKAREQDECPLLWWLDKLNTLQLEFAPIPAAGVQSYIAKHLKRAGWKGGHLFAPEAAERIHRVTGGVPRKVSETCERVLHEAAERNIREIGPDLVEELFGVVELPPSGENNAPRDPERDTLDHEPPTGSSRLESATGGDVPVSAPPPRREVLTPPTERPTPAEPRRISKPVGASISMDAFFGGSSGGEDAGISAEGPTLVEPERKSGGRGRWIALAASLLVLGGGGAWLTLGSGLLAEDPPTRVTVRPPPPHPPVSQTAPSETEDLQLGRKIGPVTAEDAGLNDDDWVDPLLGADLGLGEAATDSGSAATETPAEKSPVALAAAAPTGETAAATPDPELETASTDEPESHSTPDSAESEPAPAAPADHASPDYANPADAAIDKPFW